MRALGIGLVALAAFTAPLACTLVRTRDLVPQEATSPPGAPSTIDPPAIAPDSFVTLDPPGEAHGVLCQPDDLHPDFPDDADLLTQAFCQDLLPGGVMPEPHGLADLQKLLGLAFANPSGGNGVGGNPAFAILAHSSALTARKITTLTPTTFVFTPPPADGSPLPDRYALLGFDPGETFVEVAVNDKATGVLNFYLVMFDLPCTGTAAGCSNAQLLTPYQTQGWSNVRIYEMTTTLNDTIFDCHVCHQPDDSSPPFLRMQEIEAPFTHWMSAKTDGGQALLSDFHAAHGTAEDYGGIPAAMIDQSDPSLLARFIQLAGMGKQPNAFPSAAVEREVSASAPEQPSRNVPPGQSASWLSIYQAAVAGGFIAAPYHDVKVTDPTKLAHMTSAYQQWRAGTLSDLPDLRDSFLDEGLRDMGFAPAAGLDGRALLSQMCAECHDARLDPTVTRDRFLVDRLDSMSRAEKDLAIQRLQLPASTRLRMPPMLFRTITDDERQSMIQELEK